MFMNPKEEFIELITEINKAKGLDELSSRMIGILFIEPREVSLDKLAERTGYSLSAVSTAMKMLKNSGLVKKLKKPGSKKIYFYMEKDLMNGFLDLLSKKMQKTVTIMKERVPDIIKKYKSEKGSREEIKILENYYRQLMAMEKIMKKMICIIEDAHRKLEADKK
ncbi:MAG: winged helix-turn-helix transcriptional regulator [archaeon]|nr:MAG: winged helix-turn-helix transcriptional regulator [archaeon]